MPRNEFECYGIGICSASVCSSLPLDETIKRLNQEYPTGTGVTPWKLARNDDGTLENFRNGVANGGPCEEHPETHKHWLFHC